MEVMPDKPGVYDPERTKMLKGIVSLCEELGVKVDCVGELSYVLADEKVPFRNCKLACYLPWENRYETVEAPKLPPFRLSIVVRVPANAVDGIIRAH